MSKSRTDFMCPFYMTCNEICDVVSDDYLAAAKLAQEYTECLIRGETPDKQSFIDRCPESEKEEFPSILKVADFLIDFYHPKVSAKTVDRALARIQELRDAKSNS